MEDRQRLTIEIIEVPEEDNQIKGPEQIMKH